MIQNRCDVLVVGAGPTGLVLAAQLRASGVGVRVVDRALDRVRESRALAVQPRTLEVLRPFGVAERLVAHGNPAVELALHLGRRVTRVRLFDIGLRDTAFPFLLFVSQAETEAQLGQHLAREGVSVERGTELLSLCDAADGVLATVRHLDDTVESIRARYVVGCDGAHSTVRAQAGIGFVGGPYPQTFLLADLDADGLAKGSVHSFLTGAGPLFFFPLGRPAPWRMLTMRSGPDDAGQPVTLAELRARCEEATGGLVRLRDPVWATAFSVHHRHATRYRTGRLFLAGDAAHIHSPAGAQGMNTGIQDAVNLGWKLALVCRGRAPERLLDSYGAERRPVGAFVLRFTDHAFTAITSSNPLVRTARTQVVPRLLPLLVRPRWARVLVFRTISQLAIRYRHSPAVTRQWLPIRGPRTGDRVPDVLVRDGGGYARWLLQEVTGTGFTLLLCGPASGWDEATVARLSRRYGDVLTVRRLEGGPAHGGAERLVDLDGRALRRLRVRDSTSLVVRPDGHIGHRTDGSDLSGAARYLARWLLAVQT
jgi:2-polyprenyl-6-methoxyphenol hydroxylase-like FAD-dependent oxidoreductase